MKKQDLIPIVIIFVLFLAWGKFGNELLNKFFPPKAAPAAAVAPAAGPAALPTDTALSAAEPVPSAAAAAPENAAPAPAAGAPRAPEILTPLANDRLELTLSSHGAGVVRAVLRDYPAAKGSATPVAFDFSERPAAAPVGYPGLRDRDDFELVSATAEAVAYRKALPGGLVLARTLSLGKGYQVRIEDRVENAGAVPAPLRGYGLQSGAMENLPGEKDEPTPLLGVDTLSGSGGVEYWGAKYGDWFEDEAGGRDVAIPGPREAPVPVEWVAVKNKYFTQILTPADGAERCYVDVARGAPVTSGFFRRTTRPIARVAARIALPDFDLAPGQSMVQEATFYVGPKVYADLKANGPHQEDILQLGFWRPIGILILKIMVWFRDHVWPYNYGLAIILLTFLIRVVFWPLNHKSMVSTRHMQEIQPLIAAVKEKHKGDPQKQQQEMMALYKEHKINPMGGCLPMLVQIPVFFALFVVLRGAIELRFSSFLWIADLSTQENLLRDVLPIGLNILPLFMGLTMWIQQKMTPTSDPQQQKMMMMMPVIFTFMFYSFPSGLSLYWSVNQVMMIVQLAWMKKFHPALPLRK